MKPTTSTTTLVIRPSGGNHYMTKTPAVTIGVEKMRQNMVVFLHFCNWVDVISAFVILWSFFSLFFVFSYLLEMCCSYFCILCTILTTQMSKCSAHSTFNSFFLNFAWCFTMENTMAWPTREAPRTSGLSESCVQGSASSNFQSQLTTPYLFSLSFHEKLQLNSLSTFSLAKLAA